jgi:protein ImuB
MWMGALAQERPDGSSLRDFAAVLEALVALSPFVEPIRLGFCVVPLRGPSRFFGGDEAVLAAVEQTVRDVAGVEVDLGVAEGLFCAEVATRRGVVVPPEGTTIFRRGLPITALGRKDLATTCRRLGLHTVGDFADLAPARVAERFSGSIRPLHRVARGELAELPDQRDRRLAQHLRSARGHDVVPDEQTGFFGQRSAGDERARAAAHRVRHRLGPEAVRVASVVGGRGPEDRVHLEPWGSPLVARRDEAPWPGRLGAPSPVTTLRHPVTVELVDGRGAPVVVLARGSLSAEPAQVVFSQGARRDVTWFAGPWPLVERWWDAPRRRAHLQVLVGDGSAMLLVAESGRWWLTGVYD